MLRAAVQVDLPSRELKNRGPVAWLRSLRGRNKANEEQGREELTIGAFELLTRVATAFAHAGIGNVISLMLDDNIIYKDIRNIPNDIRAMRAAARASDVFDRRFEQMSIAMTNRREGVHLVADVCIEREVLTGEREMTVDLSARIDELRPVRNELAYQYEARMETVGLNERELVGAEQVMSNVAQRLKEELAKAFNDPEIEIEGPRFQIIQPSRFQLGALRHLTWGRPGKPRYHPRPELRAAGWIEDPFFYFYEDRWYDLACWMMLRCMERFGTLAKPDVRVVKMDGSLQFTGEESQQQLQADEFLHAVNFAPDGQRLKIDGILPDPGPHADLLGSAELSLG